MSSVDVVSSCSETVCKAVEVASISCFIAVLLEKGLLFNVMFLDDVIVQAIAMSLS